MKRPQRIGRVGTVGELRMLLSGYEDDLDLKGIHLVVCHDPTYRKPYRMEIKPVARKIKRDNYWAGTTGPFGK